MNFAKLTEIKVVANGMTDLEGMYIKEKNKAAINKSSFNHFAASLQPHYYPGFRIRIRSDPGFFAWIRIRFSNFS